MDKRNNTGSGWYAYEAAVAPAPATKLTAHTHALRLSNRPAQQQHQHHQHQQQQQQHKSTTTACGNSSPRLAATFQSMSVNVLQSTSSGVHSWPSARQDEQPPHPVAVNSIVRSRQTTIINLQRQGNNGKLQKLPPQTSAEQFAASAGNRTKPRNKSEEAINDLLQRIPNIGLIFDVHSRIGNGTFSTVLLATLKRESQLPDSMRRKFAIKHHIPTSHPDRIMKELQCMTDMGGIDNVVGINCCLRCEASAAFVMPYMPHDRFHDFYTKMEVPEIRLYMRNLLFALRHVHKFNIIHRDVKPSNFLYNRRQGQFLLVDFGLAQHVTAPSAPPIVRLIPNTQDTSNSQDMRRCSAGGSNTISSKRPREANTSVQHTSNIASPEAALKRMRLVDDATAISWNKMPLKPVNEITQQSNKGFTELTPDDPKQCINETGAAQTAGTAASQAQPLPTQPEQQSVASSSKYNTNRTTGSNGKCFCFANPSVCINCLMKKEVHASRAGTPGYRPPEVLLKYADQTTAVDVWAAGVIFLSILSSVYPFFKAPNDFVALAEIITIFGDRAIRKTALALERMVTISQQSKPLNLRKLCLRFRHRLIFGDIEMIKKHESPDGKCSICKNCDQYFFNCLCEESDYETEPLDPYECFPASAYDLLSRLLEINPHNRISAEEALKHPFFTEQTDDTFTTGVVTTRANLRGESLKQTPRKRNIKTAAEARTGSEAITGTASKTLPQTLNKS